MRLRWKKLHATYLPMEFFGLKVTASPSAWVERLARSFILFLSLFSGVVGVLSFIGGSDNLFLTQKDHFRPTLLLIFFIVHAFRYIFRLLVITAIQLARLSNGFHRLVPSAFVIGLNRYHSFVTHSSSALLDTFILKARNTIMLFNLSLTDSYCILILNTKFQVVLLN